LGLILLSTGKSFKTSTDTDMIAFGEDVARVQGMIQDSGFKIQESENQSVISSEVERSHQEISPRASLGRNDKVKVEVTVAGPQATGGRFSKKFLINGVAKSRSSLAGLLPTVLFRPEELEIIIDGPSLRREFLHEVLEQVDKEYSRAKNTYDRSLRQRNALLRVAQETGRRNAEQFDYWDSLLIESGQLLTAKREEFLDFVNSSTHDIFPLQTVYDKSTISKDRLEQYREAEVGAGVTLVGPHRDDFMVEMKVGGEARDIRSFGSRGQQRLAVLQLKLLQIEYIKEKLNVAPLLILDDIFSELDSGHIQLVLDKVKGSQIILTTTHKEFIPTNMLKKASVIELKAQ
jgi:DNA replication and repair protein RecF